MTRSSYGEGVNKSREMNDVTLKECISPVGTMSIEPELLKKAEELKRSQKELIANRDGEANNDVQSTTSPNSAVVILNPATLVTPPLSSTQNSTKIPEYQDPPKFTATLSNPSASPSRKKRGKPAPLDVDALRRERQYSGPYSANPILNRKRSNSDCDKVENEDGEEKKEDSDTQSKEGRAEESLQLTPHSGSHNKLTLPPLLPQISPAPFVSPALARDSFPLSPLRSSSSYQFGNRIGSTHTPKRSTHFKSFDGDHRGSVLPSLIDRMGKPNTLNESKREKFLELCNQIWDLFESP